MRLFFSIDPPQDFKNEVEKIQAGLRNRIAGTFVDPKVFHVTTLFLGNVLSHRVVKVSRAAAGVSGRISPFTLVLQGVGFVNGGLAVIFEENAAFSGLSESLRQSLKDTVNAKLMDWHEPHLTLLRYKKGAGEKALPNLAVPSEVTGLSFLASSFYLVESTLTSEGPRYRNVERFDLAGNAKMSR